jgi:hypothetical protein
MRIVELPPAAVPSHPHFQIFTSGLAAKFTFLIDTDSGKTWCLATSKTKQEDGRESEETLWDPFEE